MPFAVNAVANYILDLGQRNGVEISPMKLQKLIYFSHGWHLAVTDKPLIDEQIEAWQYGPVVPTLFHDLKKYGNQSISEPIMEYRNLNTESVKEWAFEVVEPSMDQGGTSEELEMAKAVIDKSWEEYGKLSAVRLSNMSHEVGGPWDKVMGMYGGNPPKSTDIPESIMRDHFKKSLNQNLREMALHG